MSKIEITVLIDEEKYRTVDAYLKRKETSFEAEIVNLLDTQYAKLVPAAVKDYLDMMKGVPEPPTRPKRKYHTQKTQSQAEEQNPENNS